MELCTSIVMAIGEEWLYSECILKIEATGFVDVKQDDYNFLPQCLKIGVATYKGKTGTAEGVVGSEGINQGFRFDPDKSDLPSRPPSRGIDWIYSFGSHRYRY